MELGDSRLAVVVRRAMHLLQNRFDDVFENNCEVFVLYCKMGLLPSAASSSSVGPRP